MWQRLQTLKPAATARVQVAVAATLWTVVGALLLFFGVRWSLGGTSRYAILLLALAIGAGIAKERLVLQKAARRITDRIRSRGDGRCVCGFVSWKTWILVGLMAGTGRALRGGLLPRPIVGLIYAGIGAALLLAARGLWMQWRTFEPIRPGAGEG